MLFRASESLVMYFRGGKFTILSMQLEESDSFSILVRALSTPVYNLSMGGFCIK